MDSSPLTIPRSGTTSIVMKGRIFILGGYDGTERLRSVECFEPGITRAMWHQVPDMLRRRSNFSSIVIEGKLLVVGGYKKENLFIDDGEVCGDVDVYCGKENKWSPGSKLNIKKSALACAVWDSREI